MVSAPDSGLLLAERAASWDEWSGSPAGGNYLNDGIIEIIALLVNVHP
jgi:hypothetical protein